MMLSQADRVEALWADVDLAVMKVRAAVGDENESVDDVRDWQDDAVKRLLAIVRRCGHPTKEEIAAARYGPVLAVRVAGGWEITEQGLRAIREAAERQESENLLWHPLRGAL